MLDDCYSFYIKPTTTISNFKRQFREKVGGFIRIYEGNKEADSNVTLKSLGAKVILGEINVGHTQTVAEFVKMFQSDYNLKIRVFSLDKKTALLDNIPLCAVCDIPKDADRKQMEDYCAYHTIVYNDDVNAVRGVNIKLHECTDDELFDKHFYEHSNYHVVVSMKDSLGALHFHYLGRWAEIKILVAYFTYYVEKRMLEDDVHTYYFECDNDITYNPIGIKYAMNGKNMEIDKYIGTWLGSCVEKDSKWKKGWRYNFIIDGKVVASYEG